MAKAVLNRFFMVAKRWVGDSDCRPATSSTISAVCGVGTDKASASSISISPPCDRHGIHSLDLRSSSGGTTPTDSLLPNHLIALDSQSFFGRVGGFDGSGAQVVLTERTDLRHNSARFHHRRSIQEWCPTGHDLLSSFFAPEQSLPPDVSGYLNSPLFSNPYAKTPARPIIADRISLPKEPRAVDLIGLLPERYKTLYGQPHGGLLRHQPADVTATPKVFGSYAEYVKLVRRLSSLEMVGFTTSPRCINGVFAVPKDGDGQRLIIDARPTNALFVDPLPVNLPTPDLMSELYSDGQPLFVAKCDLSDFYHSLRLPDWLSDYFALPPIRSRDLGIDDDGYVYPKCRTMPMGFSHETDPQLK